ncbi:MAG: ABC transporter substrate-binding protein [Rhodospirillales bacterium]|jgi:branched-chain amino acid transport system substrate-binding protein|nr:ABC transporter substrate-binding protein [Rhodospirillales bacterium]MDP7241825.1 ABC transporter substrate-binding protein [Rhodospirillales bacterium]
MKRFFNFALAFAGIGMLALGAGSALAGNGPGISDKEILICSYQPMTGKISSYFRMGKGADAWFKHVNDTGGIHGRKVNYKMVDDKYEPARTKSLVKRFIERDKCFAIVAPLGSAPTAAVIDYITSKNVPLIGAGTGAEKNLTFPSKYVFPLYPSYFMEGQELVRFASKVFGAKKVALLYQNDPSGKTHLKGINSVIEKYGVKLVESQGYDQKEIDVSAQVIAMKNSGAEAVLCSCAPEPAARFYTERKKLGWNVPVINVFFGKSPKVPELAGKDAVEGVYFTTIFRGFNSPAEQIQLAKKLLKKYYPEEQPDAIHLWGFTGAQVFTEAMRRMGRDNLTRDRLVKTLEGIDGWKGSVVPEITIGEGNAPEHFLVKDMSYVIYKGGEFQDFTPPWQQ